MSRTVILHTGILLRADRMLLIITAGQRVPRGLVHANQYVQTPAVTEERAKKGQRRKLKSVWASQESGIQV